LLIRVVRDQPSIEGSHANQPKNCGKFSGHNHIFSIYSDCSSYVIKEFHWIGHDRCSDVIEFLKIFTAEHIVVPRNKSVGELIGGFHCFSHSLSISFEGNRNPVGIIREPLGIGINILDADEAFKHCFGKELSFNACWH
jgi:hypothetical protein